MIYTTHKNNQTLNGEEMFKILQEQTYGVLSLYGEDNWPYGVPLNYFFEDGYFYFHCANFGHKIEALEYQDKACFTVVSTSETDKTLYNSIISFGTIEEVEEPKRKLELLKKIANHFKEELPADLKDAADHSNLDILAFRIMKMTGKQSKYLL